ncbi:hypothetical protein [Caldalkalibacillus salinus]|uniref:hypothetical protein n=1 Tax=Caldalkalibacillus salinus TaxID=2803787 RepID=UPI00192171DB|nr:hypothetical protein [Caldalkalibacillus salinus]
MMGSCATWVYTNVDRKVFEALRADAKKYGVDIPDKPSGKVNASYGIVSVSADYNWREPEQELDITVTSKPFFLSCGQMKGYADQAVKSHGGTPKSIASVLALHSIDEQDLYASGAIPDDVLGKPGEYSYAINIGPLSIEFKASLTPPSVEVDVKLLGYEIGSFRLDPSQPKQCIKGNALLANAELCVEVDFSHGVDVGISGKVCALSSCRSFDKKVHIIG